MSKFDERLEKELAKLEEQRKKKKKTTDIVKDRLSYLPSSDDDIGPVHSGGGGNIEPKTGNKDLFGLDLVQKGAFNDGYDFGDITKTILGTAGDVVLGAVKGAANTVGGVIDLAQYGVAGAADLLGADDFAKQQRQWANKDVVNSATKDAEEWLDDYSILGNTSTAITEGLGQVGTTILTGGLGKAAGLGKVGVTALTSGSMFASGMGSGMSEAYNEGATDGEAVAYGTISGAADALSEMLFGGLGKGLNATGFNKGLLNADDLLAKKVSGLFKKQLTKNLAEYGIKAGAEGFEEVIAGIAQAGGKKLTYMSKEDFSKILEDENLLEQFVVGSVVSGIAQAKGVKVASDTKTDFVTGRTQNEQAVIEREVENRIAEMEADGTKLTNKQKAAIEVEVEKDLEKGYISTDTIEEVLGGTDYLQWKNDSDVVGKMQQEYDDLSKEYDDLYSMKNSDKSNKQIDREAELKNLLPQRKSRLDEINSKQNFAQTREQISKKVYETAKADRLIESYNEKARKTQAYEADLSKYDDKQKAVIQKAIDSGILNNTNRTHAFVDMVAKISADKGVLFDFTTNQKLRESGFAMEGVTQNGFVNKNGDITVNLNAAESLNYVVGHEITHVLEGTEMYSELQKAVEQYAKGKGEYDSRLKSLTALYAKHDPNADPVKELTADLVGKYLFTDEDFINNLSTNHRNVFQKVYDEIKYLLKVATAGSKEARQLEKAKRAFEKAYKKDGKANTETKYSVSDKNIKDISTDYAYGETYYTMSYMQDGKVVATLQYGEYDGQPNVKMIEVEPEYRRKGIATKLMQELQRKYPDTEIDFGMSTPDGTKFLESITYDVTDDAVVFDREKLKAMQSELNELQEKLDVLYDTDPLTEAQETELHELGDRWQEVYEGIHELSKSLQGKKATKTFVKTDAKYSLSDSNGRQLTQEQQDYFKDSVVRDENGNLKVMYHGSKDGGFHVFDPNRSDDGTSFFFVDRNTVAASYSGTSETYSAKAFRTAEDFNKFFAEIGANEYEVREKDGKFHLYEDGDFAAESDTADGIYEEFRDWSGKGYGDVNYKVYLNLKNPFIVDARGAEWNGLPNIQGEDAKYEYIKLLSYNPDNNAYTIEYAMTGDPAPQTKEVVLFADFDDGVSTQLENLGLGEELRDVPAKPNTTRDYAEYARKNGYDGVILKNIVDVGGYGGDYAPATVAIAFDSNQIKSVANTQPTGDPDIRYSLSEGRQENDDIKVMDGDSVTKYSLSTWTIETQDRVKKDLVEAGYDEKQVDKWIKDTNGIASVIASDKDRLDYVAADNQKMLKDNQEYVKTLDASTLCAKRLVYQGTFNAIQHRMPNTMLSSDDLISLLNMMKERGVQTPCGVCYVESRRRHLGKFAQEWLNTYEGEYKPNLDEVTTSDGLEALRQSHPDTYEDFMTAMKKKGSANPKVVELRTEYRNEIRSLTPAQIRKIEAIGGLRVQSFSDFETPHLLDMMQAVMDMSAKGLHSQAYTKVPNFAWVFGDTGIKINLSLIAEGDGFDADGNLAFSSVEGMDISEAMRLRDAYSQNVGTIIVGANDKHILACMADDRIDFIIPFHRSGWGKNELNMMGMSSYTDYTYGQNEHDLETGKGVKNLYPPDYWDYGKSGKENAEKYLNLCANLGREPKFSQFLVNNGDGSYSLQPDGSTDGYWKTLIDFKMYDNDGNSAEQQVVQPNFNMEEAHRVLNEYEGGANRLPVANEVVDEFVKKYQGGIQNSLSYEGEAPLPGGGNYRIYGKDIALPSALEDIAPVVQKKQAVKPVRESAILGTPATEEEVSAMGSEMLQYAMDDDAPPEMDAPYFEDSQVKVEDPFENRDWFEVSRNRKTHAYMYENPEVKPFFQDEAQKLLDEFNGTIRGERFWTEEGGYSGVSRMTSKSMETLLDDWNMRYDDIERGLNAIIKDNGAENIAAAKKIEFMLNDRLLNGYWDFWTGQQIPPSQEYIQMLEEKQITEYHQEAFERLMANPDQFAPFEEDPAEVTEETKENTETKDIAPLYDAIPKKGRNSVLEGQQSMVQEEEAPKQLTRKELHKTIIDRLKSVFTKKGYNLDHILKHAKNLSTFATVDNTPQRVMNKALGYKPGEILADETVNKVAQNESEGIKWLNGFTGKKNGILAQISRQYQIKPGSKESAAAQMYAEGFWVNQVNDIVKYGDAELFRDFRDPDVRRRIKGLANDPRIRQIYDETLNAINESRARNAYPEIPRLKNYFLHFRAMNDTFSRLGLPFNPNDIRAKDLPTDLNGVTADLKPGQPFFASAMHRKGIRTSFDLLGGLEKYLTSAKNQIYHIDDIQTLRALRNYIADTWGQAHGLESLDDLSEEETQERIKEVYDSHLSTFAKFLNEEANILAGKTSLIDRGIEGIIGRRGMTFFDNVNRQVGANMVGYNVSSSLTNFLAPVQAFAKMNKSSFIKGFAQTVSNRFASIAGKGDGFAEQSPVMIRRQGADRFHRTFWQKISDPGYALMGAVDSISTEIIARSKYNELTKKGMDSQQAHFETDKWVSRLMGDRSLGQQPQIFNSKMLGLVTKFQLEVRNQLDSQFYDTIQEAKVSNERIQHGLARNAKTAAKITSTLVELAVVQHLFGKAFESIAGYNPAFDIISAIATAFGWDDEEDSEDTAFDNIEQGLNEFLEDMPYASVLMDGGRIPISSALPIGEFIKGEDQYGNEKSRWKIAGEAAPYYFLPGGYGQIKKTAAGLGMFSDEHPIAGSYTNSGNLRFPVEDTTANRVQAAIFGQYASENARDYFDNERSALKPKQTQELIDVGMSIQDYWQYRDGLKAFDSLEEKMDYINSLDLTTAQKNILVNNIADRKEAIDISDYDEYSSLEEFDYANKNPEKYAFFDKLGIDYNTYKNADEDAKKAYDWAYENPEKYSLSKAIAGDVVKYRSYTEALNDIKADKDSSGKSISGSRKEKVANYINSLDMDYGEKIILFKSEYEADDTYNEEIIDYLNNRSDITYAEMVEILKQLGFTVTNDGNVYWD